MRRWRCFFFNVHKHSRPRTQARTYAQLRATIHQNRNKCVRQKNCSTIIINRVTFSYYDHLQLRNKCSASTGMTIHSNAKAKNFLSKSKLAADLYSALSWETHLYRAQVWHMLTRITQFYLPPTRLSTSGMNPTFTPQPQSVTALWPVLIFHPTEDRRLSWPEWLATNRGGLPSPRQSLIPVLTGPQRRLTSLIETNVLPLSQAANNLPPRANLPFHGWILTPN